MIRRFFNWLGEQIMEAIWAIYIIFTVMAFIGPNAQAGEFLGSDVGVYVGAEHITSEQDAVQLGLSFEWEHFDFYMSHGVKRTKWRTIGEDTWQMDEWQSGSIVGLTWYPFDTATIRPMLLWSHSSDITRGDPFNDQEEPSSDFMGIGLTYEKNRFEVDFAIGHAGRECAVLKCYSGSGTFEAMVRFRGYIWR